MNNKKIYIEAGANDGIFQSRSLGLTNNHQYFGILIEPIIYSYEKCLLNRPNNTKIYNCALVDFDYKEPTIEIYPHSLYSAMTTLIKSDSQSYDEGIKVPARTLDSILEENNVRNIEAFYLDVEGYELNVLKGINFFKRKFNLIEIECHSGLVDISLEEEINNHKDLLSKYGYLLSDQNNETGGNPKITFKQG